VVPPSGLQEFFRRRRNTVIAELDYSYKVEGQHYNGKLQRDYTDEDEAKEFVRGLEGQAVAIRYNPNSHSDSLLPEVELATLLANRPPSPEIDAARAASRRLPSWLKPLLWLLVLAATVGLIASISVHVATFFGRQLLPEKYFFILHSGIFVVFVPAVFIAKKRGVGSDWKSLLRKAPEWMQVMDWVFGIYAFINFAIFFIQTQGYSNGTVPHSLEWRGFSGHWMVFYSVALSVLYPAAVAQEDAVFGFPDAGGRGGRPY
jgi:hypothetical protein